MKNLKQKLYGLTLIILGLIVTLIFSEITLLAIALPVGIYAMTTKENVLV